MKFGLGYDFRAPAASSLTTADVYAATLDQIGLADGLGYDDIWVSEHHFVDDGYLPSPLTAAAAVAARTRRVRIGTNVLLVPFYHPIRLAEDCAVLDNVSGGRFVFGPALGYRIEEFATFGVDRRQRSSIAEEAVEIVVRCWTEERFSHHGQHFHFDDVRCTPKPLQQPRPEIWFGAMKPAAIRRAARMGEGLVAPAELVRETYVDALRECGKDWARPRIASSLPWVFTSRDPERDWEILKPFAFYHWRKYTEWNAAAGEQMTGEPPADYDELREKGPYVVATPEEVASRIRRSYETAPFERYWNMPWWPGAAPEMVCRSIELFADEVIPRLRDLGE